MKFNRHSRFEDVLFVLALLVPAVLSGARYLESDREMTQIAQAAAKSTELAAQTPETIVVAQMDFRAP